MYRDIEKDFREACGKRIEKMADVSYVFQDMNNLPDGYTLPEGRVKPWGTGHAILSAKDVIDFPFAVINADDFYGHSVYKDIHDYLITDNGMCMAGYKLGNTLSENGSVSRGVCETENGFLKSVTEVTDIPFDTPLSKNTIVSMNLWGFKAEVMDIIDEQIKIFLKENINEPKKEFFIPSVVDTMINKMDYKFKVVDTDEKWYGITYKEDLPLIQNAIKELTEKGLYR